MLPAISDVVRHERRKEVIPCKEDLEKLARNVSFKEACTLSCSKCEWKDNKKDCRILAKEELAKEKTIDNTK